jgi:glutathione synthase/RimK-type ligase-like ATP-grasp enzyme
VANPVEVVRWSTDKRYLDELDGAGVPVVPTSFVAPGDPIELPDAAEYVVKPSVGAGSRGAGRFPADRADAAREHAAALHRAGRTVLVQPYLDEVDTAGETALVYVDDAIGKAALLPAGYAHPVGGASLYAAESICAREPSAAERRVGEQALIAIRSRFGADQLYARVDLLQSPSGPLVTELELVEPSLFLGYAPRAADTLAAAIAARA